MVPNAPAMGTLWAQVTLDPARRSAGAACGSGLNSPASLGMPDPSPANCRGADIVGLRAGKKIPYDGAAMRITNEAGANQFLSRAPRESSSL
jgi:hypothetical protein